MNSLQGELEPEPLGEASEKGSAVDGATAERGGPVRHERATATRSRTGDTKVFA